MNRKTKNKVITTVLIIIYFYIIIGKERISRIANDWYIEAYGASYNVNITKCNGDKKTFRLENCTFYINEKTKHISFYLEGKTRVYLSYRDIEITQIKK